MSDVAPDSPENAIDKLYRRFGMDLPMGDVAILLDASGSMLGKYDSVRSSASSFSRDLSSRENLHLRVFAHIALSPLEERGDKARDRVEAYLPKSPIPGRGTDLGLAIEKGIDFLEREGSGRVQALFLLTDGLHEPPKDSPYSHDFDNDPEWRKLRERAKHLTKTHQLYVYGFGIGQQTDISVLRKVFPARNVELVVGAPSEVANVLRQVRNRTRREQLRLALMPELQNGNVMVDLGPPVATANGVERSLTIHSNFGHLPVRMDSIALTPDGNMDPGINVDIAGFSGSGLDLPPGGSANGQLRARIASPPPAWGVGRTIAQYRFSGQVVPRVTLLDAAALKELEIGTAVSVKPALAKVEVTAKGGKPIWMLAGLCAAILITIVGLVRLRQYVPATSLQGTLARSGDRNEAVDLAASSSVRAAVGPKQWIDVAGLDGGFGPIAEFCLCEDGKFAWLAVEDQRPGTQVNGEPLSGTRQLSSGDTLSIGRVRLTVTDAPPQQVRFLRPKILLAGVVFDMIFFVLLMKTP